MNFLAHAYLSFRQPNILVGNMISDFVKGKKRFDYPPEIQYGITLHRAIDSFTDEHPLNLEAKKIFQPAVKLYAAAFLDVAYDHFLASDIIAFPGNSLSEFSQWVYNVLGDNKDVLPPVFAGMYPYMKQYDWLTNYQYTWGIERSMQGLVRRASYLDDHQAVYSAFEAGYDKLKKYYERFFPELLLFAADHYRKFAHSIKPGSP